MLNNTYTLAIDTLHTGVTTDRTFQRYDEYNSRTVYISENHAPDARDLLTVYRTFPKPSGVFKGVRKTTAKFTRDTTVEASDGTMISVPAIIEINFSLPVGYSTADIVEFRQTAVALLNEDTIMDALNVLQSI